MSLASTQIGRRERNKQAKLARIVDAASELFAAHGVDDVTTQQIADRADIGTGTLFLYAKTKGELLLLVQNSHYAEALERGRVAAALSDAPVDAMIALLRPIIECNRVQVDNGRTYLREMVFGDPAEPRHHDALSIVSQTEKATADILTRTGTGAEVAAMRARIVSAIMFLTLGAAEGADRTIDELTAAVRAQLQVLLEV